MAKQTPLFDEHKKLKAKIVDFAGYSLPILYTSIKQEHNAVRTEAGIFDVSHMGEILVTGSEALSFVQYIGTNDASRIKDNQAFYTLMCRENGGIVDDLIVLKYNNEKFLLIVNASNIEKDFDWIKSNTKEFKALSIENLSDKMAMVAIQGPKAESIVQKAFNLTNLPKHFFFDEFNISGETIIFSRTGYTGEDGFELIMPNQIAVSVWQKLMESSPGKLSPCGLGARDTLRIEASYMLYGNDIDENHTPIEAGLNWAVKEKGNIPYIGKEILLNQKKKGTTISLIGFQTISPGIPRHGDKILSKTEEEIGVVTSSTVGPFIHKTIGMGYVKNDFTNIGNMIYILHGNKKIETKVVRLPFYKRGKIKAK